MSRRAPDLKAAIAALGLALALSGCALHRTHIYLYQPCDVCGD